MASAFAAERKIAIDAVRTASTLVMSVFQRLVASETVTKTDHSPVTGDDAVLKGITCCIRITWILLNEFITDMTLCKNKKITSTHWAVVNSILEVNFPHDPVVGEEDGGDLRQDPALAHRVTELVNETLRTSRSKDEVIAAIDRGNAPGGSTGRFWTLDPIDGTKGFLAGGQFAVCLALIVDGKVRLGVLGCPNLPVQPVAEVDPSILIGSLRAKNGAGPGNSSSVAVDRGCLFIAVENEGAFQRGMFDEAEKPIKMSQIEDASQAIFCESVEAGHSSHAQSNSIASQLRINSSPVRMDSQCKYGVLARGDAHIYLRLPVRADYQEKIWDHASGSLVIHEAGGIVSDAFGNPLDFSCGRTLAKNKGVIAASSSIYPSVIETVKQVLEAPKL